MRRLSWALALALLPVAAAAGEPMPLGSLPWRVPGVTGFTVDAAVFPDSAGPVVEVYVRIPPATIATLARDTSGEGTLAVEMRLRPGSGGRSEPIERSIRFTAADTVAGFGKVLLLRAPARPGNHRLTVRVTDPRSQKRGILYLGRKVAESAEVDGAIAVPPPTGERRLSSIEFVWEDSLSRAEGPFQRAGRMVIPNPERLYGLFAPRLRAFFTAQAARGDARAWRWVGKVTGPAGEPVWEQQGHGEPSERLEASCQIDLDWPAGGYDLTVEAWQEGDPAPLTSTARFAVAWRPETWFRNPSEVEDHVHFLLSPEAIDRFVRLNPGEQERHLNDFWLRRDPTPGTEPNEARETFDARVRLANQRYSRAGIGLGMFSDIGRTLIRYGEPDEVIDQAIPTGDDTINEILAQIAYTEHRTLGDIHEKGLGADLRPFMLWIYEGDIPLPPDIEPDDDRHVRRRRLLFLFVDDSGVGDYRMRYASE